MSANGRWDLIRRLKVNGFSVGLHSRNAALQTDRSSRRHAMLKRAFLCCIVPTHMNQIWERSAVPHTIPLAFISISWFTFQTSTMKWRRISSYSEWRDLGCLSDSWLFLRLSDSFTNHKGFLRQHPRMGHNLRRTRGDAVGWGTVLLGRGFDSRWFH